VADAVHLVSVDHHPVEQGHRILGLFPLVPYRQLVFTIPVSLRKSFLFDRSLYGELCRAGGRGRNVADPAYWEAKFVSSFVVKEKRERRLAQSVMNLHQKRWIP